MMRTGRVSARAEPGASDAASRRDPIRLRLRSSLVSAGDSDAAIDALLERNLIDPPEQRKRIAVVMDYGQYLAPAGDVAASARAGAGRLVRMLGWATNPLLRRVNVAIVLLTDSLSEMHPQDDLLDATGVVIKNKFCAVRGKALGRRRHGGRLLDGRKRSSCGGCGHCGGWRGAGRGRRSRWLGFRLVVFADIPLPDKEAGDGENDGDPGFTVH
jgi:hypothetical protein